MCGRYTLTEDVDELAEVFEADVEPIRAVHEPRFNIAPTQDAPVVIAGKGGRRAGLMRWGLVPHWAEGPQVGARMINARSETVATRKAFRDSFLARRCLVPADGFYEWQSRGSIRQPYWLHSPAARLFGLAGIWSTWRAPSDVRLHSYAILTRPAPEALMWLHDRVPVILPRESWTDWLARGTIEDRLTGILASTGVPDLDVRPVSTRVNRADYEESDCTDEVDLDDETPPDQISLF